MVSAKCFGVRSRRESKLLVLKGFSGLDMFDLSCVDEAPELLQWYLVEYLLGSWCICLWFEFQLVIPEDGGSCWDPALEESKWFNKIGLSC